MLSNPTAAETPAERKRQRYGLVVFGLFAVGIVGLAAGVALDAALVGSAVYLVGVWSGVLLGSWLRHGSSVTMSDERDRELERKASSLTTSAVAVVGLGVFPVLFVLDAAGRYSFGPTTAGALYVFSAMGLTWGAIYALLRWRS